MTDQGNPEAFLAGGPHAVVGASRDRSKVGNRVLLAFRRSGMVVFPVNPSVDEVEGLKAYPDITSMPQSVHGVCMTTPPHVTESVIEEAGRLGVKHVWLQPGTESTRAVARAQHFGMNVVCGGPCILVALSQRGTTAAGEAEPIVCSLRRPERDVP